MLWFDLDETVEVDRARKWIQSFSVVDVHVVPVILQHIEERAAYLERRTKRACMKPIRKNGTTAPNALVQAASQAHSESLHRARERPPSLRFDDEMDVVTLNGVLH